MRAFISQLGHTLGRLRAWPPSTAHLAVALLGGMTLAFYHRLWLPDLVLISRDAFGFFLPFKQYVIERLSTGELPQWFPYAGMGHQLIGASSIGIFHPFTALYFFLPVHEAYRFSTLLSCLLAALGAFVLGRTLGLSRAGSLLAGVSFSLSGYVVSLTDNLLYLYSICVLPLFCWALEKALKEELAWVVAPAILWATVFLNGDIQTGYYYGFIALLWMGMRAPGSYREACVRLGLTGVLAALVAGVELAPGWAVYVVSDRAQPAPFHETALHWSTHPLRLLTIVASPVGQEAYPVEVAHLFFGGRSWDDDFPTGLWAESLYLGVPVMGLALMGARWRRDLRVFVVLGGLGLILALGRYGALYEIFFQVMPFWAALRYPEKLMGVATFALAMLAGAGLDVMRRGQGSQLSWFTVALLCAGLGVGLRAEAVTSWTAANFGASEALARGVIQSASEALLFSFAAGLSVGLVGAAIKGTRLRVDVLLTLLMAIVVLDLFRANQDAYHTAPVEAATFTPGLAKAIQRHAAVTGPGHFRIHSHSEREHVSRVQLDQWMDHQAIVSVMSRQALNLESNAQFQIESIQVYLPYQKQEGRAFLQAWPEFGIQAAARFNVAYFIGRSGHFKRPLLEENLVAFVADYDLALVHSPVPVKPRAYLSRRPEVAASPVDLAALFQRPDFLSGEVDVIELREGALPGPSRAGSVAIEHYAPEEVRVRVESQEQAVLVLLDTYDAGWRATLETGEEVPILRANGLVRAVVVPAGNHLVAFTYEAPLLRVGALCSLIGVLGCLGLVAHRRWGRGRAMPPI